MRTRFQHDASASLVYIAVADFLADLHNVLGRRLLRLRETLGVPHAVGLLDHLRVTVTICMYIV